MAAGLAVAAIAASRMPKDAALYDSYDQSAGARAIFANAPGGAYIQCDPRNPSSPVRCKPDGW